MKTLTKTFARRVISALLVTIMVFSLGITSIVSTSAAEVELAETGAIFTPGSRIFLNAELWKPGEVRLAAYFCNGEAGDQWYSMFNYSGDVYYADVPSGNYTTVIFCRMNKDQSTNDWKNCYNQTVDLAPVDGMNCFKAWFVENQNSNGEWSLLSFVHLRGDYTGGSNWGASDTTTNKMTATNTSGIYTKDVVLETGYHDFLVYYNGDKRGMHSGEGKVVFNACTNWGMLDDDNADNFRFFSQKGTYTFTYNTKTNKLTITPKSITEPASIYLHYSTGGSSTWKDVELTPDSAGKIFTLNDVILAQGAQKALLYVENGDNDLWLKSNSSTNLTFTNNSATVNVQKEYNDGSYAQNIQFTTDYEALADFSFDTTTQNLTISYDRHLVAQVFVGTSQTVSQGEKITISPTITMTPAGTDWTATYKLYNSDENGNNNGEATGVTVLADQLQLDSTNLSVGKHYYIVGATVTAAGETLTAYSSPITVTVNEAETIDFIVSVTADNVNAGETIKIKAEASVTNDVSYECFVDDVSKGQNTSGEWSVDTSTEDGGKTLTIRVVAYAKDDNGNELEPAEATTTVKVISSGAEGENLVTIYFKSAESLGYIPQIKVGQDGTFAKMTKDTAVVIGHNDTNTGHYWWYKATAVAEDGIVEFTLTSERFYKNRTYTLDITKEVPEEAGVYTYYFAIDNLNDPNGEIVNLTGKDYKNNFNNITDMIVETDPNAIAELGVTFRSVSVGDANDDGKLNVRDATAIQKSLAKTKDLTDVGELVADYNNDGKITVKDATAIQKAVAGL